MTTVTAIESGLAVIGAGMAGLSAAFFAARRGIPTVLVGGTGEVVFASGPWDLLGIHPIAQGTRWDDPWQGLEALAGDLPQHPYARLRRADIEAAFEELLAAFDEAGCPYRHGDGRNCDVVTPVGTIKRTYCLPRTMWAGARALRERPPCLLVDFEGMRDFSARQIATALQGNWPEVRSARIAFPGADGVPDLSTEVLARWLELPATRARMIESVRPHLHDALAVGMPAVLGLQRSREVHAELEAGLGIPLFEIPTPPVSVPGLRIQHTFEKLLRGNGVRLLLQKKVLSVAHGAREGFVLQVGSAVPEYTVRAAGVVLATGRFLGGGLFADRAKVREPLFGLPVLQPDSRASWHRAEFLDPRGHPINLAGLDTDARFRPLSATGQPAHPLLFAAGSILAHQDWMRAKCGSGLAISTAHAAVRSFIELART